MVVDQNGAADLAQEGAWLPVLVAAQRLSISERTLRRHIGQGRYQVHREGRRVRVLIPGPAAADNPKSTEEPDDLASVLQFALQTLATALEAERARADRLEARMRALEDERWALEVPPITSVQARPRRRARGA